MLQGGLFVYSLLLTYMMVFIFFFISSSSFSLMTICIYFSHITRIQSSLLYLVYLILPSFHNFSPLPS